jgi:hypothetical protein
LVEALRFFALKAHKKKTSPNVKRACLVAKVIKLSKDEPRKILLEKELLFGLK